MSWSERQISINQRWMSLCAWRGRCTQDCNKKRRDSSHTAQCRQTAAGHKHWWIAAWVFKSRYFKKNTQSIVRNIQQPFSLIPERMTLTSRLLYSVAWLVLLFERKNRLNRFFWMNQNQTSRSMIATNIRFPNEWL